MQVWCFRMCVTAYFRWLYPREELIAMYTLNQFWGFQLCQAKGDMGFPCGSAGKESACSAGDLGWEDPLEKGKDTHSSILAWRIPWSV